MCNRLNGFISEWNLKKVISKKDFKRDSWEKKWGSSLVNCGVKHFSSSNIMDLRWYFPLPSLGKMDLWELSASVPLYQDDFVSDFFGTWM